MFYLIIFYSQRPIGDGSVQENFLKYVGTKTATLQIFRREFDVILALSIRLN